MLCDEHFGGFHVIATVCATNLLIQVNGPIAKEIGMNSGFGYLGPGNRANSTIGRAVSLCAINLGWMDFSIDGGMKGNPSRYCNLTFTESDEFTPWQPFHVTLGFDKEDSTVMIDEILHIDWLCDSVRGAIPRYDELLPMSRPLVRLLGVYRETIPPEKDGIQI